jgi:hypothetical protein
MCWRAWRPGARKQIELGSAARDRASRRIGNAGRAQEKAPGPGETWAAIESGTAGAEKGEADR